MTQHASGGSTIAAGGSDAVASVQQSTATLSARLADLQAAQGAARRQTILIVLVLVAEVLLFVLACFAALRQNFSNDAVMAAVQTRTPRFTQEMRVRLQDVGVAVAPIYRDEAARQLRERAPDLEKRFADAMHGLREEVAEQVTTSLEKRLDLVVKRLEPDLRDVMPGEAGPDEMNLVARFGERAGAANEELVQHIQSLHDKQLVKFDGALKAFDLNPLMKMENVDLEWRLMHLLVQLVEQKLSESAPKGAAAVPPAAP